MEVAYSDAVRDNRCDYGTEYEGYDWDLARLVSFLASLKCSLGSFRLSFHFYDARQQGYYWSTADVPTRLAQNSDLRKAVAAFQVKSTVEIVVNSGEQDDCKEFVPFALAVKSSRQWAFTLDKDWVSFDNEEQDLNEQDGDENPGKDDDGDQDEDDDDFDDQDEDEHLHLRHIWTFTLKPATPNTQGQIPALPTA